MKYTKNIKVEKSELVVCAIIILIVLAAVYPYWIFGQYSMIGWYDEMSGTVPWYIALKNDGYQSSFLFGYSGGAGTAQAYLEGTELFSLYSLLLKYFDFWIANLTYRLIGFAFSIIGVYLFLKRAYQTSPLLALAGALSAIFVNFIPYGWMAASVGWSIGVTAWISILIIESKSINVYYLCGIIFVSILGAVTTPPVFLPIFLLYFLACFPFVFPELIKNKNFYYRVLLVFSLFSLIQLANWGSGIYTAVIQPQVYSARILEYANAAAVGDTVFKVFVDTLKQQIEVFKLFIGREPNQYLMSLYLLGFFSSIVTGRKIKFVILAGYLFFLPYFVEVLAKVMHLRLLEFFQWNTLWEMQSLILSTFIVGTLYFKPPPKCDKQRIGNAKLVLIIKYATACALFIISALSIFSLTKVTLLNLNAFGGAGIMTEYRLLTDFKNNGDYFRVISSNGFDSSIPTYYGIYTYDGLLHNSPLRRNRFNGLLVHEPAQQSTNTGWQVFGKAPKNVNLQMLSVAGVSHIISKEPIDDKRLTLVGHQAGSTLLNLKVPSYYWTLAKSDINVLPSVYIYRINHDVWPLVVNAKTLVFSKHDSYSEEFHEDLKALKIGVAIVANDDAREKFSLTSNSKDITSKYSLVNGTLRIPSNGMGEFKIINLVYTPYWKASCDGKPVTIYPVNGIMMGLPLPVDCQTAEILYTNGGL